MLTVPSGRGRSLKLVLSQDRKAGPQASEHAGTRLEVVEGICGDRMPRGCHILKSHGAVCLTTFTAGAVRGTRRLGCGVGGGGGVPLQRRVSLSGVGPPALPTSAGCWCCHRSCPQHRFCHSPAAINHICSTSPISPLTVGISSHVKHTSINLYPAGDTKGCKGADCKSKDCSNGKREEQSWVYLKVGK
jgi:hypothetical protein